MDGESRIPPDEFWNWVPIQDAYLALAQHYNNWDATRAQITRRLSTGLMASAAHVQVERKENQQQRTTFVLLPPEIWVNASFGISSHLWVSGEADIDLRPGGRYRELAEEHLLSLFSVRLDRAALNLIVPIFLNSTGVEAPVVAAPAAPAQGASETIDQTKRPVSDKLLESWAALFNDAYPAASEAKARQSFEGMFPDKSVTRDRLRRVLPDRQPGRPRKIKEK